MNKNNSGLFPLIRQFQLELVSLWHAGLPHDWISSVGIWSLLDNLCPLNYSVAVSEHSWMPAWLIDPVVHLTADINNWKYCGNLQADNITLLNPHQAGSGLVPLAKLIYASIKFPSILIHDVCFKLINFTFRHFPFLFQKCQVVSFKLASIL